MLLFGDDKNEIDHCDKPCQRADLFMSALELEDIFGGWRPLMAKDDELINIGTCSGYCQFSSRRLRSHSEVPEFFNGCATISFSPLTIFKGDMIRMIDKHDC
ncbi:unnamed protein product [Oikopleura dioica]|uniref:TGF-beta family profile domain-containing protein n=1 Tax=Oikopleura dioica TaxID=34765 RepID=E4XX79_OIKDI|nr:unnamed protein product [Oikopleura dioica]